MIEVDRVIARDTSSARDLIHQSLASVEDRGAVVAGRRAGGARFKPLSIAR